MNLKKILTVAAVSVTGAAFALLIVIFAMPNPEDRPRPDAGRHEREPTLTHPVLSNEPRPDPGRHERKPRRTEDIPAFFKKYPAPEALFAELERNRRPKTSLWDSIEIDTPYRGFSRVNISWDEQTFELSGVAFIEPDIIKDPPPLYRREEKERIRSYAKEFYENWGIISVDIAVLLGIDISVSEALGETENSRVYISFVEAENEYSSGRIIRHGAKIFISRRECASSNDSHSAKFAE